MPKKKTFIQKLWKQKIKELLYAFLFLMGIIPVIFYFISSSYILYGVLLFVFWIIMNSIKIYLEDKNYDEYFLIFVQFIFYIINGFFILMSIINYFYK